MTTIDIHPHIIASDATRYPLAPLGGHQSDWSRTRPVTLEELVAAMDEAGVQKAAIVQASTCYGHPLLMWPTLSRPSPSVSPAFSPSMCWLRMHRNACGTGMAKASPG